MRHADSWQRFANILIPHDGIDPTVGAFSVLGLVLWLPRWFREGGRLSTEQVASDIANIAMNGLLRPNVVPKRKGKTVDWAKQFAITRAWSRAADCTPAPASKAASSGKCSETTTARSAAGKRKA